MHGPERFGIQDPGPLFQTPAKPPAAAVVVAADPRRWSEANLPDDDGGTLMLGRYDRRTELLHVEGLGYLGIHIHAARYITAEVPASVAAGGRVIFCKTCKRVSANPNDVEQRYCGFCHEFHEQASEVK